MIELIGKAVHHTDNHISPVKADVSEYRLGVDNEPVRATTVRKLNACLSIFNLVYPGQPVGPKSVEKVGLPLIIKGKTQHGVGVEGSRGRVIAKDKRFQIRPATADAGIVNRTYVNLRKARPPADSPRAKDAGAGYGGGNGDSYFACRTTVGGTVFVDG